MRAAQINLDVERGKYNNALNELLALARVMFRLDQLEAITRRKAAFLHLVDEVEVYLAYQVNYGRNSILQSLLRPCVFLMFHM